MQVLSPSLANLAKAVLLSLSQTLQKNSFNSNFLNGLNVPEESIIKTIDILEKKKNLYIIM